MYSKAGELESKHGIGGDERVAGQKLVEDRLNDPGHPCHAQDGEVKECLVLEEEAGQRLNIFTLDQLLAPPQHRHGLDVRVAAVRAVRDIRDGVVMVVLIFPPRDREALPDVADHDTNQVVEGAVGEDLVVQEIVGEPAALLPEQAEAKRGQKQRRPAPRVRHEDRNTRAQQSEIAGDLEGIVQLGRPEQAERLHVLPHLHHVLHVPVPDLLHLRRPAGVVDGPDAQRRQHLP